ncbi:MAG: hypothetical protein ACOYOF_07335 [Verrucomicrobiaceae bacterium]
MRTVTNTDEAPGGTEPSYHSIERHAPVVAGLCEAEPETPPHSLTVAQAQA